MAGSVLIWERVEESKDPCPRPAHERTATVFNDNMIIIFGGENCKLFEELHVYDISTGQWFIPKITGEIPRYSVVQTPVVYKNAVLFFGGSIRQGRYSNLVYQLDLSTWEWRCLFNVVPEEDLGPCGRTRHSFTLVEDRIYLFGGLTKDPFDPTYPKGKYLNDMHTLDLESDSMKWEKIVTIGTPPVARESHTAIWYKCEQLQRSFLVIFGGIHGHNLLGDVCFFDTQTRTWCNPRVYGLPAFPRYMHTSTLIGNRMFIFGGWIARDVTDTSSIETSPICSNNIACLNLETLCWENVYVKTSIVSPRAGHSAAAIDKRLFIWSGFNGSNQPPQRRVCWGDMWTLDVSRFSPDFPPNLQKYITRKLISQ